MIIFGGSRPGALVGIGANERSAGHWVRPEMAIDPVFAERLTRIVPAELDEMPQPRPIQRSVRTGGVLYSGLSDGSVSCAAVAVGDQAAVGRGGAEDVCWWVRPASGSSKAFARMSRRHATFRLRDGRAWLVDESANGTLLNGRRITKGRPVVLADGDLIDLAGAMPFTVRLYSSGDRVCSLLLRRHDELSDTLSLILTQPGHPCVFDFGGERFWTAWAENGVMQLKRNGVPWENVASGVETEISVDVTAAWHELDGAIDQDQLL